MKSLIISHPWLIFLAFLLGIAAAALYYWKDKRFDHISKLWVYLMALLRFTAVFLLTLLLAGILVKTVSYTYSKPIVVWLQDNSMSIKLANDSSKLQAFDNEKNRLFKDLARKYDLRVFAFDKNLTETSKFTYSGKFTDISSAISSIKSRFYNQNLGAIILVSDGIYNLGYTPTDLPDIETVPIYTVLLGDTTTYKDLRIKSLYTNKIAYLKNKFPVQVEVAAKKLKGKTTKLTILDNGKPVVSKTIAIDKNDFFAKYTFYLLAAKPGKKIITAKLDVLKGEHNKANNYSSTVINVVNNQKKILILARFPHPDIGALGRSLQSARMFSVKYVQVDKFNGDFSKYDLVVFSQMPENKSDNQIILKAAQLNKPMLFVCGTKTDYNALQQLGVNIDFQLVTGEFEEAIPSANPAFDLFILSDSLKNLLPTLPPLIVPLGQITLAGNGQTIIYKQFASAQTKIPLIAVFPHSTLNNSKLGIITGEGIWRWRMNEYKTQSEFSQVDHFFRQLIMFLASNSKRKRFVVNVPDVINQGDEVTFTAQLYDRSYQAVTTADVKLVVQDSAGHTYKYLFDKSGDSYILNIGVMPPGVYKFKASTQLGQDKFMQSGSFAIKPINLEALDLQAKKTLMEQLALSSGAKFVFSDSLALIKKYLAGDKTLVPQRISEISYHDIIGNIGIFIFIFLSLLVEWILRKYFGSI